MAITEHLKSFWWLVDDQIGGMGRPGFNQTSWYDLPFEEGVLLSWLGKQTATKHDLREFHAFVDRHGQKIAAFYGLSRELAAERTAPFADDARLIELFQRLNDKVSVVDSLSIRKSGGAAAIEMVFSTKRLRRELEILRQHKVQVVVSLLEKPINQDLVGEYFAVHHFAVDDLNEPHLEQVCAYADVLRQAKDQNKIIVTHCLAGIGRTTTMLFAAHLLYGHKFDDIACLVAERNPSFKLVGKQAEFLRSLADRSLPTSLTQ